jgi:alkanesulfonate monooxygenase SsuD/methylene tetrahydromethanopterin reductase-like flavin-dependent oxidoreductase (luciferase family)
MQFERLGISVIPGTGWRAHDVRRVALEAEEAGFDAIVTTEVNNDAMATAQLMGAATQRIHVGTWIANIYLRHSYTCAKGAALIADATDGRFILGLGVSHQPVNNALRIDMTHAVEDLRRYAEDVQRWLRGEGPTTHLPQQPAVQAVPVYIAALGLRAVERAAEFADGVMATQWPPERVVASREWADRGRLKAPGLGPLDITLGIPTFIGDDLEELRRAARQNLALYTHFPYFQRMYRDSGFGAEADRMERGAGPDALSDRLLDSICLLGPIEQCRERLAEFRDAGVELPILGPPIGPEAALAVIRAFRREATTAGAVPAPRTPAPARG